MLNILAIIYTRTLIFIIVNHLWSQLSLSELLAPAIGLAEEGYPVAPLAAVQWELGSPDLVAPSNTHGRDMLLSGRAPRAGDIMRMPFLAQTFRVRNFSMISYVFLLTMSDCDVLFYIMPTYLLYLCNTGFR